MEIKVSSCNRCPFKNSGVCRYNVFVKQNFQISWEGLEEDKPLDYELIPDWCPLTIITITKE